MAKHITVMGITLFFVLVLSSLSFCAEEITITTYYPSPYGSYNKLTTTGDTYLATSASAKVGIGTTSPSEKLHVNGNARIDGTLSVTTLGITNLTVSNDATIGRNLTVNNNATIRQDLAVGDDITAGGNLTVEGNIIINSVAGFATLVRNGMFFVENGNVQFRKDFGVWGNTTLGNAVTDSTTVNGRLTVSGCISGSFCDLGFKNNFRITEAEDENALYFLNQRGEKIMKLDEAGNLFVKGKIKENSF